MTSRTVLRPDGVSIAVTDLGGDGPVVLLLHGLARSARELLPTAQALPGYRVKRTEFCSYLFLRGLGTWRKGIHQSLRIARCRWLRIV